MTELKFEKENKFEKFAEKIKGKKSSTLWPKLGWKNYISCVHTSIFRGDIVPR